MLFSAFCGGTNRERSSVIDDERTVNLMRATVESDGAAIKAQLVGTPGLLAIGDVATIGGRGVFTQDGQTWTVVGDQLYELTIDPLTEVVTAATARGTILNDGFPVSFACNGDGGQQLAVVGGGQLKVLDLATDVLSAAIALPLVNAPLQIGYLDGYFLLLERDTLRIWFSALEDGALWDGLDFFARSTASDRFVAMIIANERVWGFGSETSEAYEDVGDADNPFQPISGSLFPIGCAAAWSVSAGPSTLRWLGRASRGALAVYRLDGYGGVRISTHGLDAELAGYSTVADAEALTIEQDGHLCYALTCPSGRVAGVTHVFDEGEHAWHERSQWNTALAREEMWRARGHAYVGTRHLVGSWDSGDLFALDASTYADDGEILRAVRRAPYLGSENDWAFIDRIELGMEPGVGVTTGQGSAPTVELRLSKDGGKTWLSAGFATLGAIGTYDTRAVWTRLGRVRIDRLVLEVVITDPVKRVLGPGLWISARAGVKSAAA